MCIYITDFYVDILSKMTEKYLELSFLLAFKWFILGSTWLDFIQGLFSGDLGGGDVGDELRFIRI